MNTTDSTVEKLIDYFERDGWPDGLNAHKLRDRSKLSADEDLPGWHVVEIERHRGVLGSQYTKGLGMNSFETYYMRYAVCLSTSDVKELPEAHTDVSIDIGAMVSSDVEAETFALSVVGLDEHSFRILDNVSKEEAVVKTLDEAESFCAAFLDGLVDYFEEALDLEYSDKELFDGRTKVEVVDEYRRAMKDALRDKAIKAWDAREPRDEEDA